MDNQLIISYTNQFEKQLKKSPLVIRKAFQKRLQILIKNPTTAFLRNHALTGTLSSFRSINITGDWRAIFTKEINKNQITFHAIGTHSQFYG